MSLQELIVINLSPVKIVANQHKKSGFIIAPSWVQVNEKTPCGEFNFLLYITTNILNFIYTFLHFLLHLRYIIVIIH